MKIFLVALVFLCLGIAACGTPSQHVAKTHGADAIALRDPNLLMKYDSVAQAIEAEGRMLMQLSLIGQSNTPIYPQAAAAPLPAPKQPQVPAQMPQNLKDAKLRWVPPPAAPCPPAAPPPPPPQQPQPQVLATAKEGGTTTKHDVSANLAYTPAAAALGVPQAFVPGTSIVLQGAKAVAKGGKGGAGGSAAAGAASSAAAAAD